tara:strand:+ start:14487 stop:14684 length:198 start_codon:yes stop_codon:yes gene_type:complete
MLQRIYLRLEILGYSRAIGAMTNQPGVTAENVRSLYESREESINKLNTLVEENKRTKRSGSVANA